MKRNTLTKVAYQNMKYYKSRNILTGVAIFLTTVLLFVVPAVGNGMIDIQFAAVNQLYPSWHACYQDVDEPTVRQLAAHHAISCYGLRSDVGLLHADGVTAPMLYLDAQGLDFHHAALADGSLPKAENEIAVSQNMLQALGQIGEIGDTITVPYQVYRDGMLDLTETKPFRICGFLKDNANAAAKKQEQSYALVSKSFLQKEIPVRQITYRFLFQVNDIEHPTTDQIQETIRSIGSQFQIREQNININREYLSANYVDPVVLPAIVGIMAMIVLAGVITIYSIYYISMNQKIQEFGRLKAIGATKWQVKQILLREGMWVAVFAIPLGLVFGTCMVHIVMKLLARFSSGDLAYTETIRKLLDHGAGTRPSLWMYVLAAVVSFCTVWISLVRPMHAAAKISEIESMRTYEMGRKTQQSRKGYDSLNIARLAWRGFSEDKKKSLLTILAMSATGLLFMVAATVLSCANPAESAGNSILGAYEIAPIVAENDRENPQFQWAQVQKDNPLSETLRKQIANLAGVTGISIFSNVRVSGGPFEENDFQQINGVPQEYAKELEQGIEQGSVTYEDLKSGDQVVIDRALLHWYPDLSIGDRLKLTVYDGDASYEKEFEIAAIGTYRVGLTNFCYLLTAKEAADRLCRHSSQAYFQVMADPLYDPALEESLREIVAQSGRLELRTWKQEYDTWKEGLVLVSGASYTFLGILAVISIMNFINTMIHSVQVRKKELGILQAVGMSDFQLFHMLQIEGLFYTAGTLLLSVGGGSLVGYPVFLYAKRAGMFNISAYHYPAAAAGMVSCVLVLIQVVLTAGIVKSVKKDSLIDRIRNF